MQQQKSLFDLKKKNAQLRKKDRRKKRAFRQKTQPILDTATSFANHQVVQTQVKQTSKTAGEVFSAVHEQTAKRQATDSAEDKKNAELKMAEKQMETALLHNEQMGLLQNRATQHRAFTTEAIINGAAEGFKTLGSGFEGLADAKKKGLKLFTEEYINDQRMLNDLIKRRADAEKAGDIALTNSLDGEIQNLNKAIGGKMEEAEREFGDHIGRTLANLKEQQTALKNLGDEIANLDNTMKEGFGKIMDALNKALAAAYKAQPCLDKEPKTDIYWCINQINYCRGKVVTTNPDLQGDPNKWGTPGECFMLDDRISSETGKKFTWHAPYFCHEGRSMFDFGEQLDKKVDFSPFFSAPKSVLMRLLSPDSVGGKLGVHFGGFTARDLAFRFPEGGAAERDYYLKKITGKLKVYFPELTPECIKARDEKQGGSATAYNALLYQAYQDAITYVIKNGCVK